MLFCSCVVFVNVYFFDSRCASVPNLSLRAMKSSVYLFSVLSVVAQDIEQVALLSVQRREDLQAAVEATSDLKAAANLTDAEASSKGCKCDNSGYNRGKWKSGRADIKDSYCTQQCGCCCKSCKTPKPFCGPECEDSTFCSRIAGKFDC